MLENLAWIVPLAIFILSSLFILMVVFIWLNSRGKFMFLYCVALNRAEVAEPWNRFGTQANSLFWFRLALTGDRLDDRRALFDVHGHHCITDVPQ